MGQFSKWAGKYKFDMTCVDGTKEHIEIEISNEERIGMIDCRIMENGKVVDMDTGRMMKILEGIFLRNYEGPQEDNQGIIQFVGKNFDLIMEELTIQFKWSTRKEMDKAKELAKKEIEAELAGGKKK